ncbi:MAG: GMC family oxidoreductase N-terminal domain-containing protein [Chloroflexi bacterium]|nr:GMC family oxidoreductase N-terminal domain-containing protein [Chloroflexota bacterium]
MTIFACCSACRRSTWRTAPAAARSSSAAREGPRPGLRPSGPSATPCGLGDGRSQRFQSHPAPRYADADRGLHGRHGRLTSTACCLSTLGAAQKYNDFNAAAQEAGAGFYQSTRTPDGVRVTAASAFVKPNLGRTNLGLLTEVRATRLRIENGRVRGVEYAGPDGVQAISTEREVVLCCGAFETPKLLMLSGIGNPERLEDLGIPVRVALPGVGENFHGHPLVIGPFGLMAEPGADRPFGSMPVAIAPERPTACVALPLQEGLDLFLQCPAQHLLLTIPGGGRGVHVQGRRRSGRRPAPAARRPADERPVSHLA